MPNVLFFTSFSSRARDCESVLFKMKQKGYNVYFVSLNQRGAIHQFLESNQIPVIVIPAISKYYFISFFYHIYFLIKFCYRNKIDYIFSHLEYCNFISTVSQFFIQSKVIIHRHHANDYTLNNWANSFSYRFTNKFANKCIVYSQYAKDFMIANEKMKETQLKVFPLMYDFQLYDKVSQEFVSILNQQYQNQVKLIVVGRLVKMKKINEAVQILQQLRGLQIDAILFIVGDGDELTDLKFQVEALKLNPYVVFTGRINNVLDYIYFSDILIHPSISESSCVVVKEAGLLKKICVVKKGVGDFDEYLVNEVNAFVIDENEFILKTIEIIGLYSKNKSMYINMGIELNKVITKRFNIQEQFYLYEKLLKA